MPFIDLPAERAEALINVQVVAPTRLTHAALELMVPKRRGTIINVASLPAFSAALPPSPLPHRATYAATKAYLVAFTELLSNELRDRGIRFQVLCPGIVNTEFHTIQGGDVSQVAWVTAEEVVAASLVGLERGDLICIPTADDDAAVDSWIAASNALVAAGRNPAADRYRRSS